MRHGLLVCIAFPKISAIAATFAANYSDAHPDPVMQITKPYFFFRDLFRSLIMSKDGMYAGLNITECRQN